MYFQITAAWTDIPTVQLWYRPDCADIHTIRETVVDPVQVGQGNSFAPSVDIREDVGVIERNAECPLG